MTPIELLVLMVAGLFAGILAGFLGIGGGTVLVPLLVALGYTPVQSVATSSLSILITAISGSVQNWRMGFFRWQRVFSLGFSAVVTAQIGAELASRIYPYYLLGAFGLLLWLNIYLVELRQRLTKTKQNQDSTRTNSLLNKTSRSKAALTTKSAKVNLFLNPRVARTATGGLAGMMAGLFGVGGGVIMVPLQILLLKETLKLAIQTSLGVIAITAISACIGHAIRGNILLSEGLILGCSGLVGAQISTRFLPKLPDAVISLAFRALLAVLSIYVFWQAWQSYSSF